jgi:acetyltransferase
MSLERVLNANSVAIVGASKSETKRGYQAIRTLLDEKYEGSIFPVNPKETSILGLTCYPKVSAIEDQVDLALITTPAKTIPAILDDCGIKGVAGAVIISGGFGELGKEGRSLEKELCRIAKRNEIRLIGPNTSGMINVHSHLNLVGLQNVPKGHIGLLSQSGNMALSLTTECAIKSRKGFSYYIGVGNEADTRFHEYLEFFKNDPKTKAILMYVEGMRNGREFLQEAYSTTLYKPIIMLKSGRSVTGKRSAGSHTGALAGMSEVARTAFRRAGVITVDHSDELFPAAETLSSLPPIRNNKVAILADGGGHATIAADILSEFGIEIPELSENTQKRLARILPKAASLRNPVDVAGGADANPAVFAECAKIIMRDEGVGGLLIVGLFGGYAIRFAKSLAFEEEDTAHQMGKMVRKRKKPLIVHSLYNYAKPHSLDLLRYYSIPVYDSVEVACKCMGVLADYGNYLEHYEANTNFQFRRDAKANPEGVALIEQARKEGRNVLLEHEAKKLIGLQGGAVGQNFLARTEDEAAEAAAKIEGNVVLKIVSQQILHKSDAGGVKLHLQSEEEVRKGYWEIIENARNYDPSADIRGVLVSPLVQDGLEVIIGTKIDDQFGPVIMFGIGGIMVEIMRDVAFRVLPLSENAARTIVEEIKSSALLNGFRGKPAYDKAAIQKLLLSVSSVIEAYPDILEMDLNPVILHQAGLDVVDARVILTD